MLVAGAEHQVRPLRAPAVLTISELYHTAASPLQCTRAETPDAGWCAQLSARFQRSESGDRVTTFIDAMGLVYRNRTIVVAMNGTESLTGAACSVLARLSCASTNRSVVSDLSAASKKHLCYMNGSLGLPLASLTAFRVLRAVALDGEPLRGPTPEEQVSEYALESEDPAAALTIAWQATSTTSAVFLRTGAPCAPRPF